MVRCSTLSCSCAVLLGSLLLGCTGAGDEDAGLGGSLGIGGSGGEMTGGGGAAVVCDELGGDGAGPYADLFAGVGRTDRIPVRGRLVHEDESVDKDDATPFNQFSQDEIKNAEVQVAVVSPNCQRIELGSLTTDDEGYLDDAFADVEVPSGIHRLELRYQDRVAGSAPLRVLPADYGEVLVRSDVDQTWLDTRFMGTADKIELLGRDASERRTLPAMERVYSAIARGADEMASRSIVFLSGSPRFFKRVLEAKLVRDGVPSDGLVLKPFKDIIVRNILTFDLDEISVELHEQIGYKIYNLMRLRIDVPASAREILMGDDTEADVVAYSLYHRFTAGELDVDGLAAALAEVDVGDPWLGEIRRVAPSVTAHLASAPAPVQTIYINRTDGLAGGHFPVGDWAIEGITRYHTGAWPLILDLYEDARVDAAAIGAIKEQLLMVGQTGAQLDAAAGAAVEDGFLDPATRMEFAGGP